MEAGVAVGTVEASYAERLILGDRFVLGWTYFQIPPAGEFACSRPRLTSGDPELAAMDKRPDSPRHSSWPRSWP